MEHSDADNAPLQTKEAHIGRVRTALGGRAAEIVYYGEKTAFLPVRQETLNQLPVS